MSLRQFWTHSPPRAPQLLEVSVANSEGCQLDPSPLTNLPAQTGVGLGGLALVVSVRRRLTAPSWRSEGRLASAQLLPRFVTELTAIEISVEAAPHKGEFFLVDAGFLGNGRVSGIEIANEEKLIHPGMNVVSRPNGTPDQYPERPHLVHVPEKGGMPRDLEEFAGIWVVSEPLKQLFEQMDAEAFAFAACDFSLADGSPALSIT